MTAQGYMPVAKTIEWGTPRYIFDSLNQEFNFTLDVCAADGMEVLPNYFNPADNGLAQDWGDNIAYMNPPYGRTLPQWVEKAIQHKGTVVALLPAKTDTRYFKRIFETAQEIRFIEGRVKYRGASVPAPFGSMIAVWREGGGHDWQSVRVAGKVRRTKGGERMSAKATLFKDMIPCEIKNRNGEKYITLDGKDIIAADCGRKNCVHTNCKRPMFFRLDTRPNGEYILRGECPNMIFGYAIHAEFLEKSKIQASLDRWCE